MLTIAITYYKKQDYIDRCLESIYDVKNKNKEFNIQVLMLVDGDDEFSNIEKRLLRTYEGLEIYKLQDNVGLFEARKKCLYYAKYENIWFIDADDYVNDYSDLLYKIRDTNFQLITFNHSSRFQKIKQLNYNNNIFKKLEKNLFCEFFLEEEQLYCIRIFKTEKLKETYNILSEYKIRSERNLDDFLILPIYLLTINMDGLYYYDSNIYNYDVYENSLSRHISNTLFCNAIEKLIDKLPFMDEFDSESKLLILSSLAKIHQFWFKWHIINLKKCLLNSEIKGEYYWEG